MKIGLLSWRGRPSSLVRKTSFSPKAARKMNTEPLKNWGCFCKISIFEFKNYLFHSFYLISPKLCDHNYFVGSIHCKNFLAICQIVMFYGTFNLFTFFFLIFNFKFKQNIMPVSYAPQKPPHPTKPNIMR